MIYCPNCHGGRLHPEIDEEADEFLGWECDGCHIVYGGDLNGPDLSGFDDAQPNGGSDGR